jgi:hypothetical protein
MPKIYIGHPLIISNIFKRPDPTHNASLYFPSFSYSQLNTCLICPMKFKFQYFVGLDWETKPASLPFGKAIHKSLETYHLNLLETGEIIPVEQVRWHVR